MEAETHGAAGWRVKKEGSGEGAETEGEKVRMERHELTEAARTRQKGWSLFPARRAFLCEAGRRGVQPIVSPSVAGLVTMALSVTVAFHCA